MQSLWKKWPHSTFGEDAIASFSLYSTRQIPQDGDGSLSVGRSFSSEKGWTVSLVFISRFRRAFSGSINSNCPIMPAVAPDRKLLFAWFRRLACILSVTSSNSFILWSIWPKIQPRIQYKTPIKKTTPEIPTIKFIVVTATISATVSQLPLSGCPLRFPNLSWKIEHKAERVLVSLGVFLFLFLHVASGWSFADWNSWFWDSPLCHLLFDPKAKSKQCTDPTLLLYFPCLFVATAVVVVLVVLVVLVAVVGCFCRCSPLVFCVLAFWLDSARSRRD